MKSMMMGSSAQPLTPQITLDQLVDVYSTLPGATPELGEKFSGLIKDFAKGCMEIVREHCVDIYFSGANNEVLEKTVGGKVMKDSTEDTYIEIPETYTHRKLNAMYRDIPLKDTTSRLLRKYFNAMANLYGVIPLGKAWEIISGQNSNLVSKEEFFAFVEVARHEYEDYCIMKNRELYLDGKATGRLDWKIIDILLLYLLRSQYSEVFS